MTKDEVTDIIYRAVQATKQENSGLISSLKKQVDLLHEHLDQQDKKIAPLVELFHNWSWFQKSFYKLIIGLSVTIGLIISIIKLIKFKFD